MLKLKLQYSGHLMQRANSLGKNLDAGKDWGQKEKGATEDEMVGWHHQLNGHEFEETPGDSEGQGSLAWQSMGSQRVEHNLATEQQQTLKCCSHLSWLSEDTYSVFIWLAQKQNVFNKTKMPDFTLPFLYHMMWNYLIVKLSYCNRALKEELI